MPAFSHAVTHGIRVSVRPLFSPQHSDPVEPRYVFIYQIRIENVGDQTAQLVWRHWTIRDPVGGDHEIEGEGVVGELPILAPGEVHEYQSFCVLKGTTGSMEGYYLFRLPEGEEIKVKIPRFELDAG
jgi:ApaG protein